MTAIADKALVISLDLYLHILLSRVFLFHAGHLAHSIPLLLSAVLQWRQSHLLRYDTLSTRGEASKLEAATLGINRGS